ncbi:MAG TPA: DUF5818 domain-containing protein [Vicinamibacterales bacterium]|nr:DUF5818 domain-containing protein [Vicinamibacterales bacterium]
MGSQSRAWRFQALLAVAVLALTTLSAAQAAKTQTFVGTITDNMCAKADHSQMQMGPTDAECVKACVAAHGATYVLYDGTSVYELSDQKAPEKFAGQRVRVVGTLDAKTKKIAVTSIGAAK